MLVIDGASLDFLVAAIDPLLVDVEETIVVDMGLFYDSLGLNLIEAELDALVV